MIINRFNNKIIKIILYKLINNKIYYNKNWLNLIK